jgi:hypothetical protein
MNFDKTPIGCPDTSVMNDQYSLHNSSEERSSHVYDILLIINSFNVIAFTVQIVAYLAHW